MLVVETILHQQVLVSDPVLVLVSVMMNSKRKKRISYSDQPPYRARVSNLPWEVEESNVIRHFEDRMQAKDIISDIVLPKDRDTGRLRGFAFVTFNDRALLEESLNLSMTEFKEENLR